MLKGYFNKTTHAAPLAIFRIVTGCMLFFGILRFWLNGWIDELYIKPKFFFSFYGLEFIKPLDNFTYLIFLVCAISAILFAIGLYYRQASILLFTSFTYIELMDKSTYLNHYYFTSLVLFIMMFIPAEKYFSIDAHRKQQIQATYIPKWTLDILKLMVFILYFFAGLAKLNSDWLLHALPLKIWLPARNQTPIIGNLFNYTATAYIFSWLGCIYDLSIGFLLWNKKTRWFAYVSVVIFHCLTAVLFPIGMFPYIMITTALLFFSSSFHLKIIAFIARFLKLNIHTINKDNLFNYGLNQRKLMLYLFTLFLFIQITLPFRYLCYKNELFWTEEGYRFSWRVMLMEKSGYAQFTVKDDAGKTIVVNNQEFLTVLQEKMMSTQPDFILQYAHLLRDEYQKRGFKNPQVYADVYVSLNGRLGQIFINPEIDLAKEKDNFAPKSWILPFNDDIKGL